jgi:pimeloyl-ACP methyl ester carboxylesterase
MGNINRNMKQVNPFTKGTVISKDGTTIGYQSIGKGPGVIVLHGVFSTSEDFTRFAEELSDLFAVHIIDRRGRGMSGPQGKEYSISKECEDVKAVQAATGATYVFGHSFGGFLALEAAIRDIYFDKMVLFEPGVSINHWIGYLSLKRL